MRRGLWPLSAPACRAQKLAGKARLRVVSRCVRHDPVARRSPCCDCQNLLQTISTSRTRRLQKVPEPCTQGKYVGPSTTGRSRLPRSPRQAPAGEAVHAKQRPRFSTPVTLPERSESFGPSAKNDKSVPTTRSQRTEVRRDVRRTWNALVLKR